MSRRFSCKRRLTAQPIVPNEFLDGLVVSEPLCKLWSLRIPVELGGQRQTIIDSHLSKPQLMRFLGFENDTNALEFDHGRALAQLRRIYREVATNKFSPSENTSLVALAYETGSALILNEADSFFQYRERARNRSELTAMDEMITQPEAFQVLYFATTNQIDDLDPANLRRFAAKIAFDCLGLETNNHQAATQGITQLTPGDFAEVLPKAHFNPVKHLRDRTRRLRDEVRHKRLPSGKAIGFVLPTTA